MLTHGRRIIGWFLLALAVAGMGAGCRSDSADKLVPVSGQVTVQGKKLHLGAVSFRPDPSRGNAGLHHPTGEIDASGKYELFTAGSKGAPLGWYKVLVFADENQPSGQAAHPVMPCWLVNVKYTREESTDLFVEVVDAPSPGAYDLTLSR